MIEKAHQILFGQSRTEGAWRIAVSTTHAPAPARAPVQPPERFTV